MTHWSNYLIEPLPEGVTTRVSVDVDPARTHPGIVQLVAHLRGLVDALGPRTDDNGGIDPLAGEDTTELLRLLNYLHRVIEALTAHEDRLVALLAEQGVSTRSLADYLHTAHTTVARRLERIAKGQPGTTED